MKTTFKASGSVAAAALLISLASGLTASMPAVAQEPQQAAQQQPTPMSAEFRQTLQSYGTFSQHARYGEVWQPTVTPESWHPYPACNWVYSKQYGWYFKDDTPWGNIVHHYGRWTNDSQMGWIWVPGGDFSPGWVVWRTSADYVGWAPMMPDQDVQEISADAFNKSGQWTFMDAKKFGNSCAETLPASQTPALLQQTKFLTDVRYVGGIAIISPPPLFVTNIIDIDIHFGPWSPWFFAKFLLNMNWVWNNLNIIIIANVCPQPLLHQKAAPIQSAPPPPPGRQGGLTPIRPQQPPPVYDPRPPRYPGDRPQIADLPPVRQLPPPAIVPIYPGKPDGQRPGRPGGKRPNDQHGSATPPTGPGGRKPVDPGFTRPGKPSGPGHVKPPGKRPVDPGFAGPSRNGPAISIPRGGGKLERQIAGPPRTTVPQVRASVPGRFVATQSGRASGRHTVN
jgi:hypothetical protein